MLRQLHGAAAKACRFGLPCGSQRRMLSARLGRASSKAHDVQKHVLSIRGNNHLPHASGRSQMVVGPHGHASASAMSRLSRPWGLLTIPLAILMQRQPPAAEALTRGASLCGWCDLHLGRPRAGRVPGEANRDQCGCRQVRVGAMLRPSCSSNCVAADQYYL